MRAVPWVKAFVRSRTGSAIINFALLVPVLVVSAGASIDFSRSETARSEIQAGLDAAVLAAFNDSTTPDATLAAKYFAARTYSPGLVLGSPQFSTSGSTITGTVNFTYKPAFLSLISVSKIDLSVQATAVASRELGLTTVTATTVSAKGAFDKQIYFFTKDKPGNITSEVLLLDYDYSTRRTTYTPAVGTAKTVSITAYDSYGYYMVAYQDESYTGGRINPRRYYSTDATAASFRRSTGACSTGTGQRDSWEDGGSSDYTDFVLRLTCTLGKNGPLKVQLVN